MGAMRSWAGRAAHFSFDRFSHVVPAGPCLHTIAQLHWMLNQDQIRPGEAAHPGARARDNVELAKDSLTLALVRGHWSLQPHMLVQRSIIDISCLPIAAALRYTNSDQPRFESYASSPHPTSRENDAYTHLNDVGSEEVLKSLDDPRLHRLLTLADL